MAQHGWGSPHVGELYHEIRALSAQGGTGTHRFAGLFGHWLHLYTQGRLDEAQETSSSLLQLAEDSGEPALLRDALHAVGNTAFRQGQLTTARAALARSINQPVPSTTLSPLPQLVVDSGIASEGYLAGILFVLGYPEQAERQIKDTLHHARRLQDPLTLAWAINATIWFGVLSRNIAIIREHINEQLSLCTTHALVHLLTTAQIAQGWIQVVAERDSGGLAQIVQGCATLHESGAHISDVLYRLTLVEAASLLQERVVAQQALAHARNAQHHTHSDWYFSELQRWEGEFFLQQRPVRRHHVRQAEACFQEAIRLAQQQDAKLWELRATINLARLWHRYGNSHAARESLKAIYGWFTEGFAFPDLQEATAVLDELGGSHQSAWGQRERKDPRLT